MAKPKAPPWLRECFKNGVDQSAHRGRRPVASFPGADPLCWLARFDLLHRPCRGALERFHFLGRQRVENSLYALRPAEDADFASYVLIAAWDHRNGGVACEAHHRRFDGHLMPPLVVPLERLPQFVVAFSEDYGLGSELERRFG